MTFLDRLAEGLRDPATSRAMPSARATAASRWSLLHVSSAAGIAIAVFCIVYFAGQLALAAVS